MPFKFKINDRVCLKNADGSLGKRPMVGDVLKRESNRGRENEYVVLFGRSLSLCYEGSLAQMEER